MKILSDLPKPKRNWFWEKNNWLSIPECSTKILDTARLILSKEEEINQTIGEDKISITYAEALINNIKDSFTIEGELVDSNALRSSLIKRLGLDFPEWRHLSYLRSEEEDKAVAATLDLLNKKTTINIDSILTTHGKLKPARTDTIWGQFRSDEEYVVTGYDSHKKIVYIAPPPQDIPNLMQKYLQFWYESQEKLLRPIGSALVHLYLVIIHPFEDGNGRMARMLADKYLIDGTNKTFRPYSISSFIKKYHRGYTTRLDALDQENGLNNFLNYALNMHLNAINETLDRFNILNNLNNIFKRFPQINEDQKYIIRTMSFDQDKHWKWQEILFDLPDDESASNAWNELVDNNCIKGGKLNLDKIIEFFSHKKIK